MECSEAGGNCTGGCQNQRFQRKEYADVSVIKTEKKGFGLRANSDLDANDFIFEYIGEVINEPTFRRRMVQYDQEGIKHFYFMSLNKSEFVDATKKGNLGRFCNHSCNPNCYVDKWVVGDKLRMGIFALRKVRAGEELVFNYNVDRYGADPQPCYCGEPNCVGFIGGKTQTERATQLPAATVEALGIDAGDGWDTAVAKKPRKKRPTEDDEEYVNSIQPRGLDEDGARKVMATLMQCKEKWIAVKLLERIEQSHDDRVIHCVMRMHAYQILRTVLTTFIEDHNVVLQVLSILDKFPRLTRNKIQDSKIEAAIEPLKNSEHADVAETADKLLSDWSKLEVAYRIRRRKFDPNAPTQNAYEERRGRQEDVAPQKVASPTIDAPKGPRSMAPQRQFPVHQRPRVRGFQGSLPDGWRTAKDQRGAPYYYDNYGNTTWQKPTKPATEPAPNKAAQEKLAIQNVINIVTKEASTPKATNPPVPKGGEASREASKKQEKWRSMPIDKQMKVYENTVRSDEAFTPYFSLASRLTFDDQIFPPIRHILDKFRHQLPKDELKRLGKEITKKLVASDYKHNRVQNPSAALSEKQEYQIKRHVKQFMQRGVEKYRAMNGRGDEPPASAKTQEASATPTVSPGKDADDAPMSDADTPASSVERKRKREDEAENSASATPSEGRDMKRLREAEGSQATPPPPPPPPAEVNGEAAEEQRALQEQEEALMRENEEAQRLEDEANHAGNAPPPPMGNNDATATKVNGGIQVQ